MGVRMAQKITVVIEDNIDGGPADEMLLFEIAGSEYEIDLNRKNAARLRQQLSPFIEHARRAGRGLSKRSVRPASSRERTKAIRAWARDQGVSLSPRGRIAKSVVELCEAATGGR
jgi:hypothetical protein